VTTVVGVVLVAACSVFFGTRGRRFRLAGPLLLLRLIATWVFGLVVGFSLIYVGSFPMRVLSDAEALIGFGLLPVSMSEIVLLYPALSRMRLRARSVAHLVDAERRTRLQVPRSGTAAMLEKLACRFAQDGLADGAPEPIRLAAAALDASLSDFARALAQRFVPVRSRDRDAAFEACASDHRIDRA
jgi:hypothetical protein